MTDRFVQASALAAPARQALLDWYDHNARRLPWRAPPGCGQRMDPYRVWLSEIMLQQTTVAAVRACFERFVDRFATVEALAAAPEEAVMSAWAGMGYYARARNLHACARAVVQKGGFPDTREGLLALPGIGAYTASAVAAIAHDRPHTPVDGNVERVLARLLRVADPLPAAKPLFQRLATAFDSPVRPGDFAQALMDLGATVCVPRAPRCDVCPLADVCQGRALGDAVSYPVKAAKATRQRRFGHACVILSNHGVLLRRRSAKGLLASMDEPPNGAWTPVESEFDPASIIDAPQCSDWRTAGVVEHVFTHFPLSLTVHACHWPDGVALPDGMRAVLPGALADSAALPSVMRKAVALGLAVLSDQPV